MSKREDKEKDNLIKQILDLFGEPDEKDIAKDIEKVKNLLEKPKSLNSFLSKYGKNEINKNTCKDMLKSIVSILLSERKDFPILMDIYMSTRDVLISNCLKKHFILKNNEPKKIENGETSTGYIKFSIGLSCIFDDDKYYHKFIKGMLEYLELCFEKNYLYQHLQKKYFQDINKSKVYTDNLSSIIYYLNKMSEDMKRVISEESNQKASLQKENKSQINNNKYKLFCVKAHVHKMKEVLDIYDKCKDNDEIINEIEKLYKRLINEKNEVPELLALKDYIEEFVRNEKSKIDFKNLEKNVALKDTQLYLYSKEIQELKNNSEKQSAKINELQTIVEEKSTEIQELKNNSEKQSAKINELQTIVEEKSTEIQELKNNSEKQSAKINELERKDEEKSTKINELEKNVEELNKKIDFIEPIVISLISRKVINYCICKILDKYKKKISIFLSYNERKEPKYKISFLENVKEVDIHDANKLLDTLFDKKQFYNEDSHLVGKELPSFITDVWELAKKNFNFEKTESLAFDLIISEDIKSGFNFGARDLSVNDYLKNAKREDFGLFVENN